MTQELTGPSGGSRYAAVLRRMVGDTELRRKAVRGHEAGETTNVRMEMTAAAAALEAIKPGEAETIVIYGDNSLVTKGMTEWVPNWSRKGWKNSDGTCPTSSQSRGPVNRAFVPGGNWVAWAALMSHPIENLRRLFVGANQEASAKAGVSLLAQRIHRPEPAG